MSLGVLLGGCGQQDVDDVARVEVEAWLGVLVMGGNLREQFRPDANIKGPYGPYRMSLPSSALPC